MQLHEKPMQAIPLGRLWLRSGGAKRNGAKKLRSQRKCCCWVAVPAVEAKVQGLVGHYRLASLQLGGLAALSRR